MSRIGNRPVVISESVSVSLSNKEIKIRGSKGELCINLPRGISVKKEDNLLKIKRVAKNKFTKAMHGTLRVLIANAVKGVVELWEKRLQLVGVGYRASVSNNILVLNVGYSHEVQIKAPQGIVFSMDRKEIVVKGIDKQKVGDVAAKIRAVRLPEPYKGKGIRYKGEIVRRKAGKAAKGG